VAGGLRFPRALGKNKLEWVTRLRGSNFTFWVPPRAFVIHSPHGSSASKRKWVDGNSGHRDTMNQMFFDSVADEGLYEEVNARLDARNGNREHLLNTQHCRNGSSLHVRYETAPVQCEHLLPVIAACPDSEPGKEPRGRCKAAIDRIRTKWEVVAANARAANKATWRKHNPKTTPAKSDILR